MSALSDPFDHLALRKQLDFQREHVFDLEHDLNWQEPIDLGRFFLPIDDEAIAFPGANADQRLVLSQLLGLVINNTISEMEDVANKLKHVAWRQILDEFPVNPEMEALGEQFFAEEMKHAELFRRFQAKFCAQTGIDPDDLRQIMPQAYGSTFQTAIRKNAELGGHAFWWVVAIVEEVSVLIYQQLYRTRKELDPLYYQVQRRHFEEESRHTSYAFLMLELIRRRSRNFRQKMHQRFDLVYSELFSTTWVVAELERIFTVRKLAKKHDFFARLNTCLPLIEKLSVAELARRLFISAPYISSVLNPRYHKLTPMTAAKHDALMFPYPVPKPALLFAAAKDIWQPAN
jgi:hypothetical protein